MKTNLCASLTLSSKATRSLKKKPSNLFWIFRRMKYTIPERFLRARNNLLQKKYIESVEIIPLNNWQILVNNKRKKHEPFPGSARVGFFKRRHSIYGTSHRIYWFFISKHPRNRQRSTIQMEQTHLEIIRISYILQRALYSFSTNFSRGLPPKKNCGYNLCKYRPSDRILFHYENLQQDRISIYLQQLYWRHSQHRQKWCGEQCSKSTNSSIRSIREKDIKNSTNYTIRWSSKKSYDQLISEEIEVIIPLNYYNVFYLKGLTKLIFTKNDTFQLMISFPLEVIEKL